MGIDVDSRRQQRELTQASSAPLLSLGLKGDSGAMADLVAQLPHVYDGALQTRQTSAFIAGGASRLPAGPITETYHTHTHTDTLKHTHT